MYLILICIWFFLVTDFPQKILQILSKGCGMRQCFSFIFLEKLGKGSIINSVSGLNKSHLLLLVKIVQYMYQLLKQAAIDWYISTSFELVLDKGSPYKKEISANCVIMYGWALIDNLYYFCAQFRKVISILKMFEDEIRIFECHLQTTYKYERF